MASTEKWQRRVRELERRMGALERAVGGGTGTTSSPSPDPQQFWALTRLRDELGATGGVLYTGAVDLPGERHAEWQIQASTESLLDADWSQYAGAIAALGNPVRLSLAQAVVSGTTTVAGLAALEQFGTTGQVYHHVNQLVTAGWLMASARGHYAVPPARVVPLLVILAAAGAA